MVSGVLNLLFHRLDLILDRYQTLANIVVDQKAHPPFCKAVFFRIPCEHKSKNELDQLQAEGIIESVQFTDWAAPIVPVLKTEGKFIRICGDFKMTVNSASRVDHYPIPKIEDLFAKLAGGKVFSKLDMSHAYQLIRLDEESRKLVVINTHQSLFQYRQLPIGVASAPGIFQSVMECLFNGIPRVTVYLDDILVTGKSEGDHLATLEDILRRMSQAGLRLQ